MAAAGSGLASYFSVFHKLLENKLAALVAVVRRAGDAEAGSVSRGNGGAGGSDGAAGTTWEAARNQAQREVAALVKELRESCEQSQHTYLHVQVGWAVCVGLCVSARDIIAGRDSVCG